MPVASAPSSVVSALLKGAVGFALIFMAASSQARKSNARLECESGVLDAGDNGRNVLVYELCRGRMAVGFESSDVVEEISCGSDGKVRLWLLADDSRCEGKATSTGDEVHELWEPLRGAGRVTAAPVRQLLTCRIGTSNRAAIIVPDARDAILETRTGDSKYERLTRRFISRCIRPNA
jgi:hypothetical protein